MIIVNAGLFLKFSHFLSNRHRERLTWNGENPGRLSEAARLFRRSADKRNFSSNQIASPSTSFHVHPGAVSIRYFAVMKSKLHGSVSGLFITEINSAQKPKESPAAKGVGGGGNDQYTGLIARSKKIVQWSKKLSFVVPRLK